MSHMAAGRSLLVAVVVEWFKPLSPQQRDPIGVALLQFGCPACHAPRSFDLVMTGELAAFGLLKPDSPDLPMGMMPAAM